MNHSDQQLDRTDDTEHGGSSERSRGVPTAIAVTATLALSAAACASDQETGDESSPGDAPIRSTSRASDATQPPRDPAQLFARADQTTAPDDSSDETPDDASDVDTAVVAEVQTEVLEQAAVLAGTVEAIGVRSVTAPISAETGNVTAQPATPGDLVTVGDTVVEVDERPVIMLRGTPGSIDRTLAPGDSGDDVAALQGAMIELGQPIPETERGTYGPATERAVAHLYASNGYEPGPSVVSTVQLDAAQAARDEAQHAHVAAEQRLADDIASRPDAADVLAIEAVVASAERDLAAARAAERHEVDEAEWRVQVAEAERDRIAGDPASTRADVDDANLAVLDARNDLDAVKREYRDAVLLAADRVEIAQLECKQIMTAAEPDPDLIAAVALTELALVEANDQYLSMAAAFGPTVPLGEVVFVRDTSAIVTPQSETDDDRALVGLSTGGIIVTASATTPVSPSPTDGAVVIVDGHEYDADVIPASDDGDPTVVRVDPHGDVSALIGSSVDVVLPAETVESVELVVPHGAIERSVDGDPTVRVVDGESTEVVDVDVIDEIDGWLAVEPDIPGALEAGDDVEIR